MIRLHAAAGRPVLGVCGGQQMLGESMADPEGVDGEAGGPWSGLGLLPLGPRYVAPKRVGRVRARFEQPAGPWSALTRVELSG